MLCNKVSISEVYVFGKSLKNSHSVEVFPFTIWEDYAVSFLEVTLSFNFFLPCLTMYPFYHRWIKCYIMYL